MKNLDRMSERGASRRNLLIALSAINIVLVALVIGVGAAYYKSSTTTALNKPATNVERLAPVVDEPPTETPDATPMEQPQAPVQLPQPPADTGRPPQPARTPSTTPADGPDPARNLQQPMNVPATEPSTEPTGTPADSAEPDSVQQTAEDEFDAGILGGIQIGMHYDAVAEVFQAEGVRAGVGGSDFLPVGWYRYTWKNGEGGVFTGDFNENGQLMLAEAVGLDGANWLNHQPVNYTPSWLNEKFQQAGFPVRVAAIEFVGDAGQYQGLLVEPAGELVGTVQGIYYAGDGEAVLEGDSRPYFAAIEGSYQYFGPDGTEYSDTYAWVEYYKAMF